MTFAQKVLARACGKASAEIGEIVVARVDVAMLDDILGPRIEIAKGLEELNAPIWNKEKVVVISDHYTPPCDISQAECVRFTRDWSLKQGVAYYEYAGPCHQVMAEEGYDRPGRVIVGTDSHTCMAGAFGAFGTGIGSTEMLGVLVTGEIWLKVPESLRITWNGKLPPGVYAKDIALKDCGERAHAGATYMALEYSGDAIAALPMDERMAICNMAVEMGAKSGYIPPDAETLSYLGSDGENAIYPDPGASYAMQFVRDASRAEPQVACPHNVDNVVPVTEALGTALTQVYIGSCTGGRLSDLHAAAHVMKGRKAKSGLRFLISPASTTVYRKAIEDGTLGELARSGAVVLAPSCGLCLGAHTGILAKGESCLSATNRNFLGRMGSKDSRVYLASAATAAASAINGTISDPRPFFEV
jgi:3-isopropylmalate/(R)-2-methylmalate dehydratase large subunit